MKTEFISIFLFVFLPCAVSLYLLQGRVRRILFGRRTKARIIEMRQNRSGMYFYFIEYEAYGVKRVQNTHVFITKEFNIGEEIEIAYSAGNPEAFSIVKEKNVFFWGVFGFLYIAFFSFKIFAPDTLLVFLPNLEKISKLDVPTFLFYMSIALFAFGLFGILPALFVRFRGTQTTGEIINKISPQANTDEADIYNPYLQFKTDFGMHTVKINIGMQRNPAYQIGNRLPVWYLESNPNKNLFGKKLQQTLYFYGGFIFFGLILVYGYFIRSKAL